MPSQNKYAISGFQESQALSQRNIRKNLNTPKSQSSASPFPLPCSHHLQPPPAGMTVSVSQPEDS